MTTKNSRIGMIGVGLMGHGIAKNILAGGYPIVLLDHPGNQPVDDLVGKGAEIEKSAAELARRVDVVILCVTGTPQVEDVLFKADGVMEGLESGKIVIDCSTALPSSTAKIAAAVTSKGGVFLDAPMTRTPKEAAEGRLNLIVGGDLDAFERCKPLLYSYAENVTYAGAVGAGHTMKLIHNFVSLGFAAVLAEAAACAERSQVAPETLLEVLAAGGGKGVVLDRLQPYIRSQDDSAFRFALSNALKDMTYYTEMARDNHAFHATAEAIRATFEFGTEHSPTGTVPELIPILAQAPSQPQ